MNKIVVKKIKAATIQVVGNKTKEEGISFATELTDLSSSEEFIKNLIEESFKTIDHKRFTYVDSLDLNPVYNFISKIFNNSQSFVKQSVNLATYLYGQSLHPNIKSGEFYVILADCQVENEMVEALIMLKSEHKDAFLTTDNDGKVISVRTVYGTSLKNIDKGCLVLNQKREDGYIVLTIDHTNSGNDARYWTDSFLHVVNCNDDYHNTLSVVNACSSFISEMQKSESADYLELALAASRNKELLNQDSTSIEVKQLPKMLFSNDEYKQKFQEFLVQYEELNGILPEIFIPKSEAIKRKAIGRMNSIRLDNNFEVRILNGQAEMMRGYDEKKGMSYYKLWFKKEN